MAPASGDDFDPPQCSKCPGIKGHAFSVLRRDVRRTVKLRCPVCGQVWEVTDEPVR